MIQGWPWKPDPDYRGLVAALYRRGNPARVHWLELLADADVVGAVLGEPVVDPSVPGSSNKAIEAYLDQQVRFWHQLGYDAFRVEVDAPLPGQESLFSEDTAALSRGQRSWVNEKAGAITSWKGFEKYPWKEASQVNYYPLEYLARRLPEGMAILAKVRGFLEPVMFLMGLETFGIALHQQPDLVQAMFDRFAEMNLSVARSVVQMDRVIGVFMGDDMGHRAATLISPAHLRKYVFPLQKRVAEIAHANGKLFLLHSCGRLDGVMEDLIGTVGVDAMHSFQDLITPVETFVSRYGDRTAAIGGVDLDLLSRGTEEQVRERTRQLLRTCTPSGAWVLGTGNTVANYIPVRNYLAMLDEGRRYNEGGA